jgi:crotonobetaine/carnitine-CoA ligase
VPLTLESLLAERAAQRPDACFLRFEECDLSFAEFDRATSELACGLREIGVEQGQVLALLVENSPEFVITWFAAAKLGVPIAPINTAFRGPALANALNLTQSRLLVISESLTASVIAVADELEHLDLLLLTGDEQPVEGQPATPWDVQSLRSLFIASSTGSFEPINKPGDTALILFTSGTTGRSKGCLLSHRYVIRQAELLIENLQLREDDVLYCPFPLFHMDAAVLTVAPALIMGATAALGRRFSVSSFWDEIRTFGATVFDFMGATLTMLHKQQVSADDSDNPVRLAWGVPVPKFGEDFEQRFGLSLVELYGSTDVGLPIFYPLNEVRRSGSCGIAVSSYEVRIFGEDECEVSDGEVGEIVVRPREPSLISDGYLGMPNETLNSRRNLWFHTGDTARRDGDGYFYFVGRLSDSIRRRGENISAYEVEEVIEAHPSILEAAAFGVPSDLTEEEVMVAVVTHPSHSVDPADLVEFCRTRLARHMIPRYISVLKELPKTPTEKIEKAQLVEWGVTEDTWDCAQQDSATGRPAASELNGRTTAT